MTDRELLELAAKALGWVDYPDDPIEMGQYWHTEKNKSPFGKRIRKEHFNPLEDDGDALRLAVNLNIDFKLWNSVVRVWVGDHESHEVIAAIEQPCGPGFDIYAATRHAIVWAAAEVGRRME